jgi:hypothetical protein
MKITLFIILAILAVIIILTAIVAAYNTYRFNCIVVGEIDAIFAGQSQGGREILTDADIEHLPPVVQKHLHYSNAVGRPKMTSAGRSSVSLKMGCRGSRRPLRCGLKPKSTSVKGLGVSQTEDLMDILAEIRQLAIPG